LILPDGHIDGLDLEAGGLLVVRDDDVGSAYYPDALPIPVTVDQYLAMGPDGTLRMVFEADAWDSTISFAPGIPVTLGGTLELTFAADVNPASQLGRTFHLFDWTGVTPTGEFAISTPYRWNLANLYSTGEVTLTAVPEPGGVALTAIALGAAALHRRRRQLCLAPALVVLWASASAHAADRVYTLVPYELSDARFAFSGTITTDGSIGTFSDASFIKDWSITVQTPSEVDVVSMEVFSSAAGQALTFTGWESLQVTNESISILESNGYVSGRPSLSLGVPQVDPTSISWNGAYTVYPQPGLVPSVYSGRRFPAHVSVFDVGETPASAYASFFSAESLTVATGGVAVPEPAAIALLLAGAFGLTLNHWRKLK
jgi:hypothetical protein